MLLDGSFKERMCEGGNQYGKKKKKNLEEIVTMCPFETRQLCLSVLLDKLRDNCSCMENLFGALWNDKNK